MIVCFLFACMIIMWISYALVGHQLITAMYEGKSIEFLNGIIEGQEVHPLGHYIASGDILIAHLSIWGVLACIILLLPVNMKISLVSAVISLAVIEAGLRIHDSLLNHIYPVETDTSILWIYDPVLGWAKGPDSQSHFISKLNRVRTIVQTNSKGLRDREYQYFKDKGVRRVLLLGDSFVAGLEVDKEDVIDVQLEKLLSKHGNYEVINAGTRGYGTDQLYLYFEKEGYKYDPDIVIYFFVYNDPVDNVTIHKPGRKFGKSHFTITNKGNLVLNGVPVPQNFDPADRWLVSDKAVEKFYNDGLDKQRTEGMGSRRGEGEQQLSVWGNVKGSVERTVFRLFLAGWVAARIGQNKAFMIQHSAEERKPDFVVQYEWEITEKLIRKMAELSQAIGARFLVYEVTNDGTLNEYSTRLETMCHESGINCLDSFRDFYEMSKGTGMFHFAHDPHWNAKGHALAAEGIYKYLVTNRWVGGSIGEM